MLLPAIRSQETIYVCPLFLYIPLFLLARIYMDAGERERLQILKVAVDACFLLSSRDFQGSTAAREYKGVCVVGGFFFGHVDERGGFRSGLRPGLKKSRCYGFIIIIFVRIRKIEFLFLIVTQVYKLIYTYRY